jgi:hypothetical protein
MEAFLRFPHIAEQIFEFLDVQSLSKCQEVSHCWQNFIIETKPYSRQLENYTSIRRSMLKKSLKNYDFQTIQKLAYCASFMHKKAVEACIPFEKPPPLEPKGPTLFYYLLSEGKLNETQFLLAKLMLLNKMKKSTSMQTSYKGYRFPFKHLHKGNREANNFQCAVLELMKDARSGNFGKAYTFFKDMVLMNQGKWGFLWGWIPILHIAVAQNHLAICKLIFKQFQGIQPLHKWGKIMLHLATLFGHRDMCEFFIDEIQEIDLLDQVNKWGENPIQMAERLGHKDICALFKSSMQKQK